MEGYAELRLATIMLSVTNMTGRQPSYLLTLSGIIQRDKWQNNCATIKREGIIFFLETHFLHERFDCLSSSFPPATRR